MGDSHAVDYEGPLERRNWFAGRLISAADLDAEQTYFRERMRRRNRLLHGWGVVSGLEITSTPGGDLVEVAPGFALDAAGNEILVPESTQVDVTAVNGRHPGDLYWLAIRWDECPSGEMPAAFPGDEPFASDWREDFEIGVHHREPVEDDLPDSSPTAAPWLTIATLRWDGSALVVDASARQTLRPALAQVPVEP